MYVNTGPYSSLLRRLSIPGLFVLAAVLLGAVAVCFFHVPVRYLRPVGPLIGLAGGVGLGALIIGLVRLFLRGGPIVRWSGVALALACAAGGASVWYALKVAQPNARGACYGAMHPYGGSAEEERARGRMLMSSVFFRLADRISPDPDIAADCYHDATDEERAAHGQCPRVLKGNEECYCGYERYPRAEPCRNPRCDLSGDRSTIQCD